MKQKIYFLGLSAVILMSCGAIFKVNHWPAAGIMMTAGTMILVLLFFPAALVSHYRSEGSNRNKLLFIITWITCFVVFTAMLFKIQHWPYAGYAMLIALPFPYLVFLPVFLIITSRDKNFNIYNTVFVLLLLALNSVFAALLALNVSKETINDSYRISGNYCSIERALGDLPESVDRSAVILKIDEAIKIAEDYQELILKNQGMTMEQWKKDPANLLRPENQNVAAAVLVREGEKPAGQKLEKSLTELVSLMSRTRGWEETAKILPSILGLGAANGDDEAWSFAYRNILIPLSWAVIYLDGVEASLGMIKASGPVI